MTMEIPAPPTTEEEARAFVRWCETEIGMGYHPDTSGAEYVRFDQIGYVAQCDRCGETFMPADDKDTTHLVTVEGIECGGVAEGPVRTWGSGYVRTLTDEQAADFDRANECAHALLPDIYATSMEIFRELHPELFKD